MEGCPRLPGLSFDLKLPMEAVNLCEKIPNYISTNYQENGDNFTQECDQINRLRQNAISCAVDETGVQWLKRYYCQLQLLRNRFPMLPETECAVRFTWEDAFQTEESVSKDVRFEEACILYNIGAMYSKMGVQETRKTHESMKNACTYFRYSAACFEKVRDQYTPYSLDFTADLLTCQVDILLAQAHEAVLEKAVLDQRPASVNAHIAMQISEYYQAALSNLLKPEVNAVISKKYREWRVTVIYKLSYYLAVAHYCCGLLADENKKRGEAVCYFESAADRLKEGWKNAEKVSSDRAAACKDAHAFTSEIITAKYKSAKRDNDSVYFEKVPALSSLPALQGAIVAKSQAFDCQNPDVCGADIFQRLVPMDIHLVASEYSEEKAKILREIIELTEAKTQELDIFMNCAQLDRIPLSDEHLRLPRELLECCAAVASQPALAKDLLSAMQEINDQHRDVTARLVELEQVLQTSAETHPLVKTVREFQDLQRSLNDIREMLSQANDSNTELRRHATTIGEHLKILSSSSDQVERSLPALTELNNEENKSKLARVALMIEKVQTMKNQREILVNDLRKKIQSDDITKFVLMRRQENYKSLFSDQLKKHEELVSTIKQNCAAQENILQSLTEANAEIADIRTKMVTTAESRQQRIQEYIASYKSVRDTLSKANEGIEFYKRQSAKFSPLRERIVTLQPPKPPAPVPPPVEHSFTQQTSPIPPIPDRPRLKDYLPTMKPDSWGATINGPAAPLLEEKTFTASAMPTAPVNSHFYPRPAPPAAPLYSTMPGQAYTSLPNFSSYPVPSYVPPEPAPPVYQPPVYSQPYSYNPNPHGQCHPSYNPSSAPPLPPQPYYPGQILPPASQQHYPAPPAPPPHPSAYPSQLVSDVIRPAQQPASALPVKFDPYRPQPVGAYDIPNGQATLANSHVRNPHDVYWPGALAPVNQASMPFNPYGIHGYDHNQFVHYVPPPPTSVMSSFSNLSIN